MAAAEGPERKPGCRIPAPETPWGRGASQQAAQNANTAKTIQSLKGFGPGCQTLDGQKQRAAAAPKELSLGGDMHRHPIEPHGLCCRGWHGTSQHPRSAPRDPQQFSQRGFPP